MQKKGRIRTGRSGEHYVCYLIEQSGLEAVRVDGTTDLHITLRSGRVLSVEVKTCTNVKNGSYHFHRGRSSADVFAFVTLGETTIVRLFPEESAPKWTMPASDFTEDRQQQDLDWIVSLQ